MNLDLFMQKVKGSIECQKRDYEPDTDTSKISISSIPLELTHNLQSHY